MEAVLYFVGGWGWVGCSLFVFINGQLFRFCLQYGTLTLLKLQNVSKILFKQNNFLSPPIKRFVLFISVTLALITIGFWRNEQVEEESQMYLLKGLFMFRGRDKI